MPMSCSIIRYGVPLSTIVRRNGSESGDHELGAGDTILIPAGEPHVTRNTGSEPLVLLCFFPTARVTARDAGT